MDATLNCDCGEGYGIYQIGHDPELLPIVDIANIACGVHGGDWDTMAETVGLAVASGALIGAHPSLPDRQGFGRREMNISPESFFNCILTQVGALDAVMKLNGVKYNHLKPHGQAYIMSSKNIELARGSARVAKLYGVPLLGLSGSAHEEACKELGVELIPEWYSDLQYNDQGGLMPPAVGKGVLRKTPEEVYVETRHMLENYTWKSASGQTTHSFPRDTKRISICVHSDLPGAVETALAVRRAIDDVKAVAK